MLSANALSLGARNGRKIGQKLNTAATDVVATRIIEQLNPFMKVNEAYTIGIDGCRLGWCLAVMYSDRIDIQICEHLESQLPLLLNAKIIFIDIPIGLSGDGVSRDVDVAARKLLDRKKSSTIFYTPCREAVHAVDYKTLLEVNRASQGKGFSIQSWNICNKIKEVDLLLRKQLSLKSKFLESHPELTFQFLNLNVPLQHKKKTQEGLEERLAIMNKHSNYVYDALLLAKKAFLRKDVALDDIVDALGLGVAALLSQKHGISTADKGQIDNCGITMNIHFVKA